MPPSAVRWLLCAATAACKFATLSATNVPFEVKYDSPAPFARREIASTLSDDPPYLPVKWAPWDVADWQNDVAICSYVSDESVAGVTEWINFHQWTGFEHVFLFVDPGSDGGAAVRRALAPFVQSGFVTLSEGVSAAAGGLLNAFRTCASSEPHHHWMAFLPQDEFLHNLSKEPLSDVMDQFRAFPGVQVHVVKVDATAAGASGPVGSLLTTYTECENRPTAGTVPIANRFYLTGFGESPRAALFRAGGTPINENFKPVPLAFPPDCLQAHPNEDPAFYCDPVAGLDAVNIEPSARLFAAYKYVRSSDDIDLSDTSGRRPNGAPWRLCDVPAAAAAQCCPELEQRAAEARAAAPHGLAPPFTPLMRYDGNAGRLTRVRIFEDHSEELAAQRIDLYQGIPWRLGDPV